MKKEKKRLVSVNFYEREELNQFINRNQIKREDVVDINKNRGLGYLDYTLTFYATKELEPALQQQRSRRNEQIRHSNKLTWKEYALLFCLAISMILMVIGVKQAQAGVI